MSSNSLGFFVQEVGVLLRHGDGSVVAQFADKGRETEQGTGRARTPGLGVWGSEAEGSRMG